MVPDTGSLDAGATLDDDGQAVPQQVPPPGFDGLQYVASHPDLIAGLGADPAGGERHYLAFGEAEGRPTDTFNEEGYLDRYPDLRAAFRRDGDAATEHYVRFGFGEGRTAPPEELPPGFDGLQYIASHDDLVPSLGANRAAGERHYLSFGQDERRATDDFDEDQYLASYPDVRAAVGDNGDAATIHYIQFGFAEGRGVEGSTPGPEEPTRTADSPPLELPDGQEVALQVTTETATDDDEADLSGIISLTGFLASGFNVAFVNDASDSTTLPATDADGDPIDVDGDGTDDTIFTADVAAFNELADQLASDGVGTADLGVISFGTSATLDDTTTVSDAAGLDATLNDPGSGGGTDYAAALQAAIDFFNAQPDVDAATNVVYFLSDGLPNFDNFDDEFAALTDAAGIDALVNAFGAGSGVDQATLDRVDNTGGSEVFTDLSQLVAGLSGSSLDPDDIVSVDISVNGVVQQTLDGSAFTETPTGLRFGPVVLTGLDPNSVNDVDAVITTDDGSMFDLALTTQIPGAGSSSAASFDFVL
jgi:hypothetical protein